jgi:membrane protein
MNENNGSLLQRIKRNIRYCISGVWQDTRPLWSVKAVKVINLSVRSFLDRDLQVRSCALTYSTVLAIVPALALLFAIARGFGFQNLLQSELFRYFPAQQDALENALAYVDNYLAQASQGVFVGIGVIFLLWTLLSLMSSVEDTFNHVWGITAKRSLSRKFTDYTALMLLLPVMMVCSAGITIFMSDAVQHLFGENPLSPMLHRLLSLMPIVISWLVFTAAFFLVPNTRVNLKGALFAGVLCGSLFQGVQWLFVTGQVYVSKYNAIYGSFAFLPLLLVWLQLSWLITLAGAVLTYSWQNIDNFALRDKVAMIAPSYASDLAIAVMTLATVHFKRHEPALTRDELIKGCGVPPNLVDKILDRLQRAGLLRPIAATDDSNSEGFMPSCDPDELTINGVAAALDDLGETQFIPMADTTFGPLLDRIIRHRDERESHIPDVSLLDLVNGDTQSSINAPDA